MDLLTFELDARRCGVETCFVDEVLSLGPITQIPSAPPAVAGAMNVRGQICAILRLELLLWSRSAGPGPAPRQGQPCLLVHTRDCQVVLCVGRIKEVSPTRETRMISTGGTDLLVSGILDSEGGPLHLIDMEQVVLQVTRQIQELVTRLP